MSVSEAADSAALKPLPGRRGRRGRARRYWIAQTFPIRGGVLNRIVAKVQAVDDVSFEVHKGETLGIVGESGCGKSTTARLLMHLIPPDAGDIVFDGKTVAGPGGVALRDLYRQVQMVSRIPTRRSIRACRCR